jgi:hypothetical protein
VLEANGGVWPDTEEGLCKGSFSGNAKGSIYNLAAGQWVLVKVGNSLFDAPGAPSNCADMPLKCGTRHAFR